MLPRDQRHPDSPRLDSVRIQCITGFYFAQLLAVAEKQVSITIKAVERAHEQASVGDFNFHSLSEQRLNLLNIG
eukprot:EC714387.1.p2 GENE.EC714387.1~~EC714387.1.p2  ORF type:complete len:74 (-),score=12.41 EC714387.1:147-368(-)